MKKDNNSIHFKDWTTRKLKEEAKGYYQSIYQIGCYGKNDVWNYEGILKELDNRGIGYYTDLNF